MNMVKNVRNIKKKGQKCENETLVGQPLKLGFMGFGMFLIAAFVGRAFNALQRAGIVGAPNVIGGFHLHHWTYSTLALVVLFPLTLFMYYKNKRIFSFLFLITCFFGGLVIEGIVYTDSFIFFT